MRYGPVCHSRVLTFIAELFEGNKPGSSPAVNTYVLLPPQDARKRADHIWTTDDDILLKKLVDKYPNNWALICDSFNSSRVTVSTDKRTLWDCLERWDFRWGGNRLLPHATLTDLTSSVNLDGTSTLPQMTTRGVKRLASSSISSGSTSGVGESKRRRRHVSMLETIRKAAKKREATQKSNRTYSVVIVVIRMLTQMTRSKSTQVNSHS